MDMPAHLGLYGGGGPPASSQVRPACFGKCMTSPTDSISIIWWCLVGINDQQKENNPCHLRCKCSVAPSCPGKGLLSLKRKSCTDRSLCGGSAKSLMYRPPQSPQHTHKVRHLHKYTHAQKYTDTSANTVCKVRRCLFSATSVCCIRSRRDLVNETRIEEVLQCNPYHSKIYSPCLQFCRHTCVRILF